MGLLAVALLPALPARAADQARDGLTVTLPHRHLPPLPPRGLPRDPLPANGDPPLNPAALSIVDDRTRFLTGGPAQARCPGQPVVFVQGVVNPFRPTMPGDGAYMCRDDAVAEGFVPPSAP